MNQITTSVYQVFDRGVGTYVTEYSAECGCRWIVDMFGRVWRVTVCTDCGKKPDVFEDPLSLLLEPEWPASAQIQRQPDTQC